MSTTVGGLKIKIDENDTEKYNKHKKAQTAVENIKRAALGDLQNRAALRPTAAKDAAQKSITNAKLQTALRGTKARVDSHWKKTTVNSTNKPTQFENNNGIGQRKVITRSNSVRLGTNVPVEEKVKTLPTKAVENKQQKLEVAKLRPTKAVEKPQAVSIVPKLRREDSQLSQISLNKIKATILRDANKGSSKPTAIVHAQQKNKVIESAIVANTAKENQERERIASRYCEIRKPLAHSTKLINAIEDIDINDANTLILLSDYVNEIYNYLYNLEDEFIITESHLEGQKDVSPKMRAVLMDWINEVHFQIHLIPETFQMTVAIIDRYLQDIKDTKRSELQLVGVTALFIATKYEELYPPPLSDLVYTTDNTYSAKEILQMELKIFNTIHCNLSRPLPIHFLRRFSKAAKAEDRHHTMSKYFIELVLIDYDMASYKPSQIAAASIFLALHLLNGNAKEATGFNDSHWTPTLQHYSRYSATELRPITKKIAIIARNAPNAKLKAVYSKYQSSKFEKISLRSELYGSLMDSIINSKE